MKKFFNNLCELNIKEDEARRLIFYPWGRFGVGYALAEQADVEKVRRLSRWDFFVGAPAFIVSLIFFDTWISFTIFAVSVMWHVCEVSRITRDALRVPDVREKKLFLAIAGMAVVFLTVAVGMYSFYEIFLLGAGYKDITEALAALLVLGWAACGIYKRIRSIK